MKKVNRKRLLMAFAGFGGLGAIGATAATLVACGSTITYYNIMPTYTGEADILLALGIAPDYYPYQLNQTAPYQYVSDPKAYMTYQGDDFKNKFEAKVKSLSAQFKGTGRTWWNQDANKSDKSNPDPEYWTHKDARLFLYEQYLLDDSYDVINSSTAPTYGKAIKTNFRVSRDPYTRLSKAEIDDHDNTKGFFYGADGKVKPDLTKDFTFASEFAHRSEEDSYYAGLLYKDTDPVFNKEAWKDKLLAGYYNNATLSAEVKAAGLTKTNYLAKVEANKIVYPSANTTTTTNSVSPQGLSYSTAYAKSLSANFASNGYLPLEHHPIYEAQTTLGEAPAYEGAVRDNLIYLYTVASDITKMMNENPTLLEKDPRRPALVKAQENAKAIITNFRARQAAVRTYFDKIGVTGKTFAMVTVAPGGVGQDTLQTDSKYAFLFDEIGLKYPWPKDWTPAYASGKTTFGADDSTVSADKSRVPIFNLDDNGWFFDVSNDSKDSHDNVKQFADQADFGVIAVRDSNWTDMKDLEKGFYKKIFRTPWQAKMDGKDYLVDYDLWNEGIKTPSVLNIVLDKVVNAAAVYAASLASAPSTTPDTASNEYKAAMNWGTYWTDTYVNS